ncbi:hypothetical protein BH23CHL1_BH23CHL1_15060 [soil metagenome]
MNDNPRGAYAIIMAIFLTIFGAVAAALRRNPATLSQTPPARDIVLLGIATFRMSRLIVADRVTSIVREPVVEEGEGEEQLEGVTQKPKEEGGIVQAVGELITCPWCVSVWAGAFNVYLLTLFPRTGRLFLLVMSSSGIAHLLDPLFPLFNYLSGYVHSKQEALEEQQGS